MSHQLRRRSLFSLTCTTMYHSLVGHTFFKNRDLPVGKKKGFITFKENYRDYETDVSWNKDIFQKCGTSTSAT